jgi:hypothetical protein
VGKGRGGEKTGRAEHAGQSKSFQGIGHLEGPFEVTYGTNTQAGGLSLSGHAIKRDEGAPCVLGDMCRGGRHV